MAGEPDSVEDPIMAGEAADGRGGIERVIDETVPGKFEGLGRQSGVDST